MQKDPFHTPLGKSVQEAFFVDDRPTWRTLGGIARQVDMSRGEVAKFIDEYHEYFVESNIKPGGVVLYRIRAELLETDQQRMSSSQ